MKRFIFLAALVSSFWGCSTFSHSYKLGNQAELNRNWAEAIRFYEAATLENPKEPVYRLALTRAKYAASLGHILQARRLAAEGQTPEALAEYARARSYDPSNRFLAEEVRRLNEPPPEEAEAPEKLDLPIKLKAAGEPVTLNFPQETSLRSLFLALGRSSGVNILFDENFRDIPFAINLAETTFSQALTALCTATKNFSRIIDDQTIIIVPDQPLKRIQYEINAVKTFFLSNIKAEEALQPLQQMISSSFKASKVFADKTLNAIIVRDAPETVALAGRLLRQWDKPRAEVLVDLEIMEVSRVRLRQLGLSFDQNIVGLRYGEPPAANASSWVNLKDLDFSQAGNFYLSLPLAFFQFLESDADTRIIAQPRLRGVSGEEIKSIVGQKVPIPKTTFAPIAAGGVSQQPITNYDYQDVGIDITVTPQVHRENEITLNLWLKITSLAGTGVADIPIITTREVKNVLRLKDGETNLLAGLLRDEERKSLTGIPGLKDLPLLGRLFSSENTRLEQTDVILMITPTIIRRVPRTAEDNKAIWVDVKESGGAAGEDQLPEDYLERELPGRLRPLRPEEVQSPAENQVMVSPSNFELSRNRGEFRMTINLQSSQPVGNLSLSLSFNSQIIRLKDVTEGPLVKQLGQGTPFLKHVDNTAGACTIGLSSSDLSKGLKAVGNLAVLLFETVSVGETQIAVSSITANGPGGQAILFTARNARVVVR